MEPLVTCDLCLRDCVTWPMWPRNRAKLWQRSRDPTLYFTLASVRIPITTSVGQLGETFELQYFLSMHLFCKMWLIEGYVLVSCATNWWCITGVIFTRGLVLSLGNRLMFSVKIAFVSPKTYITYESIIIVVWALQHKYCINYVMCPMKMKVSPLKYNIEIEFKIHLPPHLCVLVHAY